MKKYFTYSLLNLILIFVGRKKEGGKDGEAQPEGKARRGGSRQEGKAQGRGD